MALDLTPEQRSIGQRNFAQAAGDLQRIHEQQDPQGMTRRTFGKTALAAGAVLPISAAVYFGYDQWKGGKPVRTALIGTGDEGGVLVGDHNKEFNRIVAVCDIRPYNRQRIFDGEERGPRKGLNKIYGSEAKDIKRFKTVDELLAQKDALGLEAVIIATPLFTHKDLTIKCLDAGLHVLCEKLMASNITECKAMVTKAREKGLLLSVGHQRHYSMLYAHALEVVQSGILGELRHIRCLWHRNNTWPYNVPAKDLDTKANSYIDPQYDLPMFKDTWYPPIRKVDAEELSTEKLKAMGYEDIRQLTRWRCFNKTGGGLMAELGSHQLDASSIFLGKVKPISVYGTGMQSFYGRMTKDFSPKPGEKVRNPRECEDGVFVTYEFPGKEYYKLGDKGEIVMEGGKPVINKKDDIVMVTYSSFCSNGFEKYGECLMGSRGSMVVEEERDVFLFPEKEGGGGRDTNVTVTGGKDGKPAMEATSTWGGGGGAAISKTTESKQWDSDIRGYRSEMAHFAFLVRKQQEQKMPGSELYKKTPEGNKYVNADSLPRCHGEIAMADAILALSANMSMKKRERIDFELPWFDADKTDNPESKHGTKIA